MFSGIYLFKFVHKYTTVGCERPRAVRGSDSHPICPPRTHAHLSPPGVPFIVLPPEKYGVIS